MSFLTPSTVAGFLNRVALRNFQIGYASEDAAAFIANSETHGVHKPETSITAWAVVILLVCGAGMGLVYFLRQRGRHARNSLRHPAVEMTTSESTGARGNYPQGRCSTQSFLRICSFQPGQAQDHSQAIESGELAQSQAASIADSFHSQAVEQVERTHSHASELGHPTPHAVENFIGNWQFVRYEGDMEGFAIDCGVNWASRKLAAGLGWGVGRMKLSFACKGERLLITSEGPKGTFVQDLLLDGTEQATVTLTAGSPTTVIPSWDNDTFVSKLPELTVRRMVIGGELVSESVTLNKKITIRQFFQKD